MFDWIFKPAIELIPQSWPHNKPKKKDTFGRVFQQLKCQKWPIRAVLIHKFLYSSLSLGILPPNPIAMKKQLIPIFFFLTFISALFSQNISFQPRGVGGGGALFFPKINPGNDKEYYVSCDMSQLFHSTDFGLHYEQLPFQRLQVFGANSTYEWTQNPQIAYCNYNDGNNGYPVRTMDGGQSWQVLPGHDPNNEQVYRITANYYKPNQLLINYYGSIYISNDFGASLDLVKNAANNGVGLIMGGVFFDGEKIYIGTNEGILQSTDGGQNFQLMNSSGIGSGQIIWSFAAGKSNGTTRFVCITGDAADVYNGVAPWDYWGFAKGIYTMDNASGVWQPRATDIDFANDFVMYAGMAWNDANTIYLGGSDGALGAPLVYKSSNGGTSWEKVFKSANNENIISGWSGFGGDRNWSWGETCFGITVAPTNSSKVMFGDFGFVHVTENGGQSWRQAYLNASDQHPAGSSTPKRQYYHSIGLENTSAWQVSWHDQNNLLAAFSDIGMIRSKDGGKTWGFDYSGLSANSVYRLAETPNGIYAAASGIHDMYQSTRLADNLLDANDNAGKVYLSQDGGGSWQAVQSFGHPVFWLAKDPNQNLLYASVIHYGGGGNTSMGGIWRYDFSSTWTHLPAPPRTEGHPACIVVLNDGKVLCTYSGRRNSSGQFTASSGVFLYDPATNSWSDRSDPGMYYWTKDIVLAPYDPAQNTWYAGVFSGWGGAPNGKGGLYRSTDRGLHWSKLSGTQFDRVTSLTFNPLNANQAYLSTETQGLWVSDNMQATTPTWKLVEEYPFRQPERVYFNPNQPAEMWVTSFGNGLRIKTLSSATHEISEAKQLRIWPNPGNGGYLWVEIPEQTQIDTGKLEVFDIRGVKMAGLAVSKHENGEYQCNTEHWPAGVYVIRYGNYVAKFVLQPGAN